MVFPFDLPIDISYTIIAAIKSRESRYFSYFFVVLIKHLTRRNLWKKEFVLAYCHRGGTHGGVGGMATHVT